MTITTIISLMPLIYVQRHQSNYARLWEMVTPLVYSFRDSLSLIMVTTASFVITLIKGIWFGRWT